MLLERYHILMMSFIFLNTVDWFHSSLLIFNKCTMRLYMSITRVKLGHKGHVRLLLLIKVLLTLNCLLFTQFPLLWIIWADWDNADLLREHCKITLLRNALSYHAFSIIIFDNKTAKVGLSGVRLHVNLIIHACSKSWDCSQWSNLSLIILLINNLLPVLLKHVFVFDCSIWLQMEFFADDVINFEEQGNKTVVW